MMGKDDHDTGSGGAPQGPPSPSSPPGPASALASGAVANGDDRIPRPTVYLSSTSKDLVRFRREVAETLRRIGCNVVGMESYVAAEAPPVERCLADAKACDVYIGIFAWRYGAIPKGYDRSFTELEYRAAGDAHRDRLIFLAKSRAHWPKSQVDDGRARERIDRLRAELSGQAGGQGHTVAFFSTPDELANVAQSAVVNWMLARGGREGGPAGDTEVPEAADGERVVNLPPLEVPALVDRRDEQDRLRGFVRDPTVRLVGIVGRPGMGKTALACRIFADVETTIDTRGANENGGPGGGDAARGIAYLNSRGSGLGLEQLFVAVSALVGEQTAGALATRWTSGDATVADKAQWLVEALHGRRYLLLLDAIDLALSDDGALRDPGLAAFVGAFATGPGGSVLVYTSRTRFAPPPEALPLFRSIEMSHGLDPLDGAALLRALDPQGDLGLRDAPEADLERTSDLADGVPLSLCRIAGILQRDPGGSLRSLLGTDGSPGGGLGSGAVETLVADAYEHLDLDERRTMQALSVFDQPVQPALVAFLLQPWFPALDAATCLRRLATAYVATASRATGAYGLLRLDREHAYGQIPHGDAVGPEALDGYGRSAVELRAADFYSTIRKPVASRRSLEDLAPEVAEFRHRIRGERPDLALDVLDTIAPDPVFKWGNYSLLIELRQSIPAGSLEPRRAARNLAGLAACHQVLGRYDTAASQYLQAVDLAKQAGDLESVAEFTGNLGRVHRNTGAMDDAILCLKAALDFYREQGNRVQIAAWSDRLALGYWNVGRMHDASALQDDALAVSRELGERGTEAATLSNIALVHQAVGRYDDAQAALTESVRLVREIEDRRGEAIALGRLGFTALAKDDTPQALERHGQALSIATALGERREESYQLIGLGRALARKGDVDEAVERLTAARDLTVPETSHAAALALAVTLVRRGEPGAAGSAFADAIERCRARLARCDRLFLTRYALATALCGAAACSNGDQGPAAEHRWDEALEELRRAVTTCPCKGPIAAALSDLGQIRGLEPASIDRAAAILQAVPAAATAAAAAAGEEAAGT
jgi:tetratricopeptide (TPR) repeat protein